MTGTIVNVVAVVLGAALGIGFGRFLKERFRELVMQGLALCVILIGLMGAITTQQVMVVILCVVFGALIGEAVNIEAWLQRLGDRVQGLLAKEGQNSTFAQGFVTASLIYCVGAMAIVGSLDSGLRGDHTTLFAKSMIDGMTAIIFASTLGIGVAFAAVPVFLYQGAITLLARFVAPVLTDAVIVEMSAVGGLLILSIGLNMLGLTKIRVGNLLPAIFLPPLLMPLLSWIGLF